MADPIRTQKAALPVVQANRLAPRELAAALGVGEPPIRNFSGLPAPRIPGLTLYPVHEVGRWRSESGAVLLDPEAEPRR